MIYAKVIEDSINPHKHRLTTMEVCYHRLIHAEMLTHRVFFSSPKGGIWKQEDSGGRSLSSII
jgi:hypothetical protein